jgi:uncharacterized protein (TIGR02646 family)
LKHIHKKPQPPAILQKITIPTDRNPQPTYKKLRSIKKQALREVLAKEQGYICCYCEGKLVSEDLQDEDSQKNYSHIEHLRPQSRFEQLSLDYKNLLVSCQSELMPGEPLHCGNAKGDWFDEEILVSPLQENCADFFEYTLAGEMLPTKDPAKSRSATATIDRLQLNIPKLKAMREAEITPLFEQDLSPTEVQKLIQSYTVTDDQGYYEPFCTAIIYLLTLEYSL